MLHPIPAAAPMKEHLVKIVSSSGVVPNAFLVLGDLTSIASPSEFKGSVAVIREIAAELRIKQENVLFTFGNHDVDWRVCSLANTTEGFPKDELYNQVAAHVGELFTKNPPGFENGPLPGSGVAVFEDFMLFVLNSGYFCVSDQDHHHGKVGPAQLAWLQTVLEHNATDPRWRILMVHHHPFNYPYPTRSNDISTLEEGAGRYGIDIVCHGHRHHPKISTQMHASWKKPVTYFCAGSLAVNETQRNSGQIPNLFHLVSLDRRLPNEGAFGSIQTFEYAASDGWRPIHNSTETPMDHIQYFGTIATAPELRALAKAFIIEQAASASGTPPGLTILPNHTVLPYELRCQSLKALNLLLPDVARETGWRIVGAYPSEVALMRM